MNAAGSGGAAPPFGGGFSSSFGSTSIPSSSGFGMSSSAPFGQSTGGLGSTTFGSSSTTPAFGKSTTFGSGPSTSFGGGSLGSTSTSTTFGATNPAPFGATSTTFGSTSTPAFGAASFGGSTMPPAPPPSFGSSSSNTAPFGATTSTFGATTAFGASTQPSSTPFSSAPTTFGSSSLIPSAPSTTFGSTVSSSSTSTFGSAAVPSNTTFGSSAPSTTFGSSAPSTTFGASTSTTFGLGSSTASTTFGSSAPSTTFGGSGSSTTFGASGSTPAFGSSAPPTTFGSSAASTTFGSSAPTTTFGSSAPTTTFGSSAPTTSFGSSVPLATLGDKAGKPPVFGASTLNTSAPTTTFGPSGAAPSTTFGSSGTTFGKSSTAASGKTVFGSSSSAPASGDSVTSFGSAATTFGSSNNASFGKARATSEKSQSSGPPEKTSFGGKGSQSEGTGSKLERKQPPRRLPPKPLQESSMPMSSPEPSPTSQGSSLLQESELEKADLSNAVNIDGLCIDMCSPKEREEQIRFDDLSTFEKGKPEEAFIIKRFQRAAASHKLDIPSEIRPLGVLRKTQLHLEQNIVDLDKKGIDNRFNPPRVPDFLDLYQFFWNRARMIRNDFTLQNYRGGGRHHAIAMDVHERIARFFILCEHELIENPNFVEQQNMEQLGKTMKSLQDFYDDARLRGDETSPFEPEFAGYFILLHLDKDKAADVLKYSKRLPPDVMAHHFVQFAMDAFVARHTNDYVTFFRLVQQATFLQSCLLHRYFPTVRSDALECMNRVYRQPYPLDLLTDLLCFEDVDQAAQICQHHNLPVDGHAVVFGSDAFETDVELRMANQRIPVMCSYRYVFAKQQDWLRRDVCRGATEYEEEDYPLLSRQILLEETRERERLYPDRPPYEDPFSNFESADGSANKRAPKPVFQQPKVIKPLEKVPRSPAQVPAASSSSPLKILSDIELQQQKIAQAKAELLKQIAEKEKLKSTKPAEKPVDTESPGKDIKVEDEQEKAAAESAKRAAELAAQEAARKKAEEEAAKKRLQEQNERLEAEKKKKEEEERERKQRLEEIERKKKEAIERQKRDELERKRKLEEEARVEAQKKRDEELKKQEIVKFGATWIRINFEEHENVNARKEAFDSAERAKEKAEQAYAIKKLRFALWRRYVLRQQQPRQPANAEFVAEGASHHTNHSTKPMLPSALCSVARIIPQWTVLDAEVTLRAQSTWVELQDHLFSPLDLSIAAKGLCARYPTTSVLTYSIGLVSLAQDRASDWLLAKCGIENDFSTHRVAMGLQTVVFDFYKDQFTKVHCLWCPLIARHVQEIDAFVAQLAAKLASVDHRIDLHFICLTTNVTDQQIRSSTKAFPDNVHIASIQTCDWDKAANAIDALLAIMSRHAVLFPVSLVNLREIIDDVVHLTLYQCSNEASTLADVAMHVQEALETLEHLVRATDSSAVPLLQSLNQQIPLPLKECGQSSVAWLNQLSLDTARRELCLRVVEDAWQSESSPFKSIVAAVYGVVLDSLNLDSAIVALPATWIAELHQLLRSIAPTELTSIPNAPSQHKPTLESASSLSLPSSAPSSSEELATREGLQAKWKKQARVKRIKNQLEQERIKRTKFVAMLEDMLSN